MANLVNAESITVRLPDRTLLDQVSLGVQTGDRIGVLGLNGSGKTTLLSVLAGLRSPDAGRVALSRDARVEMVTQTTTLAAGAAVRDVVLHTFAGGDHVWAADAAVRAVLDGLGLAAIGLDTVVDGLSGGERRRVALAAALVTDADLLILDEPTNHLDIEGVAWLAEHLLARRGAVLTVTHDRWFLDAVATRTWEVVDGAVHVRDGGYSDWVFARAERLRLAGAAEERRKNLARKELAWLRRGPPARTSKPRYRIEAAEALIADVPEPRNTVALLTFARNRLGHLVIDLEDITVTAGPGGRRLLDEATWRLAAGARIGLVGVNGSGKTSLLRVMVGDSEPVAGRVRRGKTVRLGYLPQDVADIPGDLRLLAAVSAVATSMSLGGKDISASQLAERFGFTAAQQWTRVAELSGGERRRLQLLRILMAEPNVLILDEPTNDLDTDTLAALEDLLDGWAGTLVVVSHDRYLIERVTDDVMALFGDGKITHIPGACLSSCAGAALAALPGGSTVETTAPGGDANTLRSLRKEQQRLERRLESLLRKQKDLHSELAAVGADFAKVTELDSALRLTVTEVDAIEGQWMAVAEQLE